MEYREFGQTGLKVSAIGFGCWELGGGYGSFDDAEVVAAVNRAIDLGINCFDTAQGYGGGASERLLARALGAQAQRRHFGYKIWHGVRTRPGQQQREGSTGRLSRVWKC